MGEDHTMDTNREVWRTVLDPWGETSDYEVSSLGRVRSQKTGREGRIMTGGEGPVSDSTKARTVWLMDSRNSISKPRRVDLVVARTFLGPQPQGGKVVHLNGRVWDDRASNLAWAEDPLGEVLPLTTGAPGVTELAARMEAAWETARKATVAAVGATKAYHAALAREEALEGAQKGAQGFDGMG